MENGQITLRLVVQPSSNSLTGVRLWPPVIGILSSNNFQTAVNILPQIIAIVTIIDENSGKAYPIQKGIYSDSLHPLEEDTRNSIVKGYQDVAYIHFPYLTVNTPGRYIIRISLAQRIFMLNNSVYEYINTVDSHLITVSECSTDIYNPTPDEQSWLRTIDGDD
ncbi:hypothetical protein F5884DRAFT_869246 [Xylogone sp. PMI_703]|nr:hypothetical protein F5884DRAFT_869246 [Xylogone sp. PMI_703]